jgi:hypothetical protein
MAILFLKCLKGAKSETANNVASVQPLTKVRVLSLALYWWQETSLHLQRCRVLLVRQQLLNQNYTSIICLKADVFWFNIKKPCNTGFHADGDSLRRLAAITGIAA